MKAVVETIDNRLLLGVGLLLIASLAFGLIWLHLPPEIVLAGLVGAGLLVALVLNPLVGIHIFVMLLYFENAAATESGLTAMQVLGPLTMTAWVMNLLLRRKAPVRRGAFVLILIAFLAWSAMTLLYAQDTDAAIVRLSTFFQVGLATLMFASVVDTEARIRQVLWAMVIWTSVATIIGFVTYTLGVTKVVTGPAENRNAFALYLDLAIVSAFMLNQTSRSRIVRMVVLFGFLPLLLSGLAMTLSRGGWIAMLVAAGALWYRAASERRVWQVVAMVAIICLILPFLPASFVERATGILPSVENREETFGERVNLWELGIKMVQDNPVGGVGIGNFTSVYSHYARGKMLAKELVAHNAYVNVAAETGLVGLGLFLALLLLALRNAGWAVRVGTVDRLPGLAQCGVVVEICLVTAMVFALSASTEGSKILWILLGLAMSLGNILKDRMGTPRPLQAYSAEPRLETGR